MEGDPAWKEIQHGSDTARLLRKMRKHLSAPGLLALVRTCFERVKGPCRGPLRVHADGHVDVRFGDVHVQKSVDAAVRPGSVAGTRRIRCCDTT